MSTLNMARVLVLDFDGTITTEDTIENLVQAALTWRQSEDGGNIDLTEAWRQIKDAYARDLVEYDNKAPPKEERTDWPSESVYLDGLRVVEEKSLARVRASGIFRGFAAYGRLFVAGQRDLLTGRVTYKNGFEHLMQAAAVGEFCIYILSVNWSASYIRGVLGHWAQHITVVANEINLEGAVYAPPGTLPDGWIESNRGSSFSALTTAGDKLSAMAHLGPKGLEGLRSCYVGDSVTDMACLYMHGGLVMAPSREGGGKLIEVFCRISRDVPHASQDKKAYVLGGYDDAVYWVSDFDELLEFWSW